MTRRSLFTAAVLCLLVAFWSSTVWSEAAGDIPAGKYYSECDYGAKDSIDTIEFLPDRECIIALTGGSTPISGTYRGISEGKLILEYGQPKVVRTYSAVLLKHVLNLTDEQGAEFHFVLPPTPPHLKANDLVGTYLGKREDANGIEIFVYKRNPDQTCETIFRELSKADHKYQEFHLTAKWTYADGISTYVPEKSDFPPEFRYLSSRDFISKKDQEGIWTVDTATGDDICEVPVEKFELPPLPAGYQKIP